MTTFYTILSVIIRPEIDEKLSFGLILSSNENVSFLVSEEKLSVIKKLVSPNLFKGIKKSINLIKSSFELNQRNHTNAQQVMELNIKSKSDVFSFNYLDYLSDYNNNVISFSKPTKINMTYSNNLFQLLFKKFINETDFEIKEKEAIDTFNQFKKVHYQKVKSFFNIEKEINSINYPKLIMPVKIDLMGKNNREVFAQSIDLSKNLLSVEYSIAGILNINRAIPKAKQFIISSEPDKSNVVNHRIWNNIRKDKGFDYVDVAEFEIIEDYAQKHDVVPLLSNK
jgi:hypothetical protein